MSLYFSPFHYTELKQHTNTHKEWHEGMKKHGDLYFSFIFVCKIKEDYTQESRQKYAHTHTDRKVREDTF